MTVATERAGQIPRHVLHTERGPFHILSSSSLQGGLAEGSRWFLRLMAALGAGRGLEMCRYFRIERFLAPGCEKYFFFMIVLITCTGMLWAVAPEASA